ncbi:Zn(2)-C6 fungal-type DNA-binding domain protein [Kalmanozyma brasiliensis GHG001]|uniref:Zn(2)-C6 fungal-type DNA-binding domain protein n=1 Tax=Kalmanozyma brasiliensis (strain GHG001) TaxID=1365824 RepID=UPI0028683979|nr:Zn(2)-C6 fungal-type DNA-binding domain protein [Kalmanozyma brasiliensis GHG001]KAF6767157.1 Zn(2)-C6 fungal-type DNA-binding domain protein [Kalmanozyma brasiliensis GHG001]
MGKRGTPRASCDPCRRKKVKCDKDQRNAEGISLCSFCYTRGYDCIITDDTRPNADKSDNDDGPNNQPASTPASAAKKKRKQSDAGESASKDVLSNPIRDDSFVPDPFVTPGPSTEPDMLNVRGLTRSILDDSVKSHFRTTYWCNPVMDPRHFYPRYQRYISKLDNAASSSTSHDIFPPADIIILAVACAGVVQLGYLSHRFDLQARIFRRLERLVSQACTKDITVALDVLEAILLTFDVPARTKSIDEATNSSLDAGYVHPMSHTKMIRLLNHHGFNRSKEDPVVMAIRLKHRTAERGSLSEINDERMPLVLAVAASNDVIRSFDLFERHQLLQEDIDPEAMMADLGGLVGNQWAWQLSVLASILRTNNLPICAARSRRLGIAPSAILEVLEQLERFERQMPELLRWNTSAAESHGSSLRALIPHDNTSEDIISILVRKAFLYCLLWSQYQCIHAMVRAHGLQRPAQSSRPEGTLYLRARQRVDSLLLTAFDRMSEICPQLAAITVPPTFASVNLLDYSSIAFRSSIKRGAYYTLEMAKLTRKAGLHELTADLLSKAGRMIYAFSTYQCHPDTQAEASKLRKLLSSLYSEYDMIPGLGPTNDTKLRHERARFSSVFEPAAAFQDSAATAAFVAEMAETPWNGGNDPAATIGTAASWATTPGTDDLNAMNDFLAGLPFVNTAASVPPSASPAQGQYAQKTPASTGTATTPFDLNAFLDTQIDSSTVPGRQAGSGF